MTRVAIMQPTFLPWLGYFALIGSVDHFVFLDDVQFSKQSWQSRNRIKGPNGPVMLSLGISRAKSKPVIADVELAQTGFEGKLIASVKGALGPAPFAELLILESVAGSLIGSALRGTIGDRFPNPLNIRG